MVRQRMYPPRELRELCACRACASNSMTLALATCEVTKERGPKTADFRAVKITVPTSVHGTGVGLRGRLYLNYFLGGWASPLAEKRL